MKRVCFDNHILIWGIRGVASPGQEDCLERAKDLFAELDEADAQVIVPSVVVAEFLAGVPKPQHTELLDVLNRRFQIPPLDVRTAAVAAGLWRDAAERNPHMRVQIEEAFPGIEKAKIKADMMILATALVRKAEFSIPTTGRWQKSPWNAWKSAAYLRRDQSKHNFRSDSPRSLGPRSSRHGP